MKIKVAGLCCEVNVIYGTTEKYCREYTTDEEHEATITISYEDIETERKKFKREQSEGKLPEAVYSDALLEPIALQRKFAEKLFERNTLLFHGSAIAVDGVAYLFTAKSGTGKSTHARLWREMLGERAVMVNDDKPFLSVENGAVTVHGSPWNGKHRLGANISVPLRAICILSRAEHNSITKIRPSEAVTMLLQQSSRPKDPSLMPKYMELLDAIAGSVAFYRLSCNMENDAARVAFERMSQVI